MAMPPSQPSSSPLEPSPDEMRRLVGGALERIAALIESLPDQPSSSMKEPVPLARSIAKPLPEKGTPYEEVLDLLFESAAVSVNTAGPGYLGYIPGGGLFHAAVADLIADAVNRYTGLFEMAPALVRIESNVISWLAQIVGYPETARGFLTSGGSLANWSALITARHKLLPLPERFAKGTIYASQQVHHSLEKAARLAGIPLSNLRKVEVDERFRIRPHRLVAQIAADRNHGLTPFLLVGNAGTTNTGAVDPLPELARIARQEKLWFHVDAAYGGFFLLTEEGREVMRGIEEADSITLDPHKGLFLPYGTGALLVRDEAALRNVFDATGGYMPAPQKNSGKVDFYRISPELTKPFRGLRIWLPVKLMGIAPFRAALEEKLRLTRWITEQLRSIDELEIVAEPQLSLVAFRLFPPAWRELPVEEVNERNKALCDSVNDKGQVYLTGTKVDTRFVIRICVLSFRTHQKNLEDCLANLRAAVDEMLDEEKR
jgi:aromatic-L-amino-acid/L-tryptophan decarboxylase